MKKNVFKLIVIIILLIIEAVVTINFSIYTADIINTGLIKKGIDLSIPFFVDEEYMNIIQKYFDNNGEINNIYTFISKDEKNRLIKYGITQYRNIYVLKDGLNNTETENKIKEIIYPIISTQNYHVKFKINNILKNNLTDEQNKKLSKAISLKKIPEAEKIVDSKTREEVLELLKSDKYRVDDIVIEQCINEYNQYTFDSLGINLEKIKNDYITKVIRKICMLVLLVLFIQIISIRISVDIAGDISKNLRLKLSTKILSLKTSNIKDIGISKLSNIAINGTKAIETSMPIIIKEFIFAPVLIIYGLYLIVKNTNMTVALLIFSSIVLSLIITLVLMLIIKPKSKECELQEETLSLYTKNMFKRTSYC